MTKASCMKESLFHPRNRSCIYTGGVFLIAVDKDEWQLVIKKCLNASVMIGRDGKDQSIKRSGFDELGERLVSSELVVHDDSDCVADIHGSQQNAIKQ